MQLIDSFTHAQDYLHRVRSCDRKTMIETAELLENNAAEIHTHNGARRTAFMYERLAAALYAIADYDDMANA